MNPTHDDAPVPVRAVLAPRVLAGAALVGLGSLGLLLSFGLEGQVLRDRAALFGGIAALGALQVLLGDRLLAKAVGLVLSSFGLAAVAAALLVPTRGRIEAEGLQTIGSVLAVGVGVHVLVRAVRRGPSPRDDESRLRVFHFWSGEETDYGARPFSGGDATAIMGGFDVDLRRADLAPGEPAVLDVLAIMGGGEVRVPADWEVENRVVAIMGGVKVAAPTSPVSSPSGRTLRIEGLALMGGLDVKRG